MLGIGTSWDRFAFLSRVVGFPVVDPRSARSPKISQNLKPNIAKTWSWNFKITELGPCRCWIAVSHRTWGSWGCGCQAGSIDVSDLNSPDRLAANCIDCSEGLTCPMMSTVPALLAGSSPNGAAFTPVVKSGCLVKFQGSCSIWWMPIVFLFSKSLWLKIFGCPQSQGFIGKLQIHLVTLSTNFGPYPHVSLFGGWNDRIFFMTVCDLQRRYEFRRI